ncbi:MAG: class I SAM-dependent methyltransferase [Candidatus Sulfotelmatobacter sp.]|jgi:2-polyprenyl-3-methyl-5-hydroxy-6-metoxy-1,4-benzoquinol methylase
MDNNNKNGFKFDHRLPHATTVDWPWLVEHYCDNKKVLDLGCGHSPEFEEVWKNGRLLHKRIHEASREVLGLDLDESVVERMRQLGFHVVCDDAENPQHMNGAGTFDAIVAGDIIEHLNNPGAMLKAMKSRLAPKGVFVISTPSPFRWYNPFFAMIGHEFNHPHHTAWFSPLTLTTLAERHGYQVVRWHVMDKVTAPIDHEDSIAKVLGKMAFKTTDSLLRRVIFRRNEWLSDTIVAVLSHA